MTLEQLEVKLHIHPQHLKTFQHVLDCLIDQGSVEKGLNVFIWKQNHPNVVTGILRVHPRGFGFLQPDNPSLYSEDIFIPKHLTMNAVDGDTVEVVVNTEVYSEKGPEGKVVTILSRSKTHIAGIIREAESWGDIYAYVPLLGMQQKVFVQPHAEFQLKVGDRVVMEVLDWGSKASQTLCRVSHYIGHISDPSCDIKAAIEEYELRAEFPQQVIEEAKSFGTQVSRKEIPLREDLRELECFTIDPDTAKDFDDAVSLSKDQKGHYHLGVHIADVSHYVQAGTALDKEAYARCNSTYFPGQCVPMLPSVLSDSLCSLKPNVNRLAVSAIMEFDPTGNLIHYKIVRSVIKSKQRFSYKEAKAVLDGKKSSRHAKTLKLMVEFCGILKKKRYERGSIEFAMPDLVVIVDENGVPQKLDYIEYDITHQLVEEFMLKANELVAQHLSKIGKNLTYRIHDVPSEENMKEFSMLARAFGYNLPEKPSPHELQKFFDEAMQTSYGQYLASCYIRRMRLAIYSAENIGHYGLGLTHYCHFTSPIRRYVDLVVHRILFGQTDDKESLEIVALKCSEQERISAKAENTVVMLKKLRLLQKMKEQHPHRQYEAIVTRVKPFGIYFELIEYMIEGFLHVSDLENDYFVFDEAALSLRGSRTRLSYSSGDKIDVMLKEVDFISLESSWSLIASSHKKNEAVKTQSEKKQSKKRQQKSAEKSQKPKAQQIKTRIAKQKTKTKKRKIKK